MYTLAFILLLLGLIKAFVLISSTKEDIKYVFTNTEYSIITAILWFILVDCTLEIVCSLFILL